MGQTLTGNQIDLSYQGLIKTTDNAALGAVEKEITDGVGTASTLKLGTTSASFVGDLDLSGATVTGLPAAASGLVSGTGTDSMKSADTLTPGATNLAGGQNAIVFGAGAIGNQDYGITIGTYAQSGIFSTVVGTYAEGSGLYNVAVGPSSKATGDGAVSVGQATQSLSAGSISLGRQSLVDSTSPGGIAIGDSAEVNPTAPYAVALGAGVIAATADTVSVKALETQTASTPTAGGIIMTDAGSVARRLNIDAAGALQIDSTPVGGGGGAAGLVKGDPAQAGSMKSSDTLSDGNNTANANRAIAIGSGNISGTWGVCLGQYNRAGFASVAIGDNANTTYGQKDYSISIGATSNAEVEAISIGKNTTSSAQGSVALGRNITAAIANTVSISALEVQTASTPTAGGIIMTDAGSVARRLNITAAGALQIDSTPVGGGGGSDTTPTLSARPTVGSPFTQTDVWSNPWLLSGYSLSSLANTGKIVNNEMWMVPITLKEGLAFRTMKVNMQTGGGLMNVGLYKATAINGLLYPEYAATIATNVDVSTAGFKTVLTSGNVVIPASTDSRYFLAFQLSDITATLKTWSQVVSQNNISADIYRINAVACTTPTTFNLPTGALTTSTDFEGTTDGAIDVQWQYV